MKKYWCPLCHDLLPYYYFHECDVCKKYLDKYSNRSNDEEYYCTDHDHMFLVKKVDIYSPESNTYLCYGCRDDKNFVLELIDFEFENCFDKTIYFWQEYLLKF